MIALLLLGLLGLGPAVAADESGSEEVGALISEAPDEDAPAESMATERIARLTKALRCPVCQGLSVSDSPSDAARAMGDRIAELVRLGYTEDQVTDYFVDRYGPWVELEPPAEGRHVLLFVAPGIILLVGFGLAAVAWRRRRPDPVGAASYTPDPALGPYRERILAELEGRST